MSNIIVVTNRNLCRGDFLEQMDIVCRRHPLRIILREKDLSLEEYQELFKKTHAVCSKYGVLLFANKFRAEGAEGIQLSAADLLRDGRGDFPVVGASVHSEDEASAAWERGADYLIAGHIFETDCKKGVPPRGLDFLKRVCSRVPIPVYAIGGMNEDNFKSARAAGAAGYCTMSAAMNWR